MIRFSPMPSLALPLPLAACVATTSLYSDVSIAAADRAVTSAAAQVKRCYRDPVAPSAARYIVTRLRVHFAADGTLIGLPRMVSQQGVTPSNQAYANRMAEAASLAIMRCSPLRLPVAAHRGGWDEFDLIFSHNALA